MTAAGEVDPRLARLVTSELPAGTRWHAYDRRLRSPMSLVLDEVARQLQREFVLIWVDGGPPDVFVLNSPRWVVTVWSTRYLELSAAFRTLLVDDAWSTVRVELARRLVLKVVAEMSLRNGDSDVAASCFLGAVAGQELVVSDSDLLADLDIQDPARMDEAHMALWFTGLAHEFGHGLAGNCPRWRCVVGRGDRPGPAGGPGVDGRSAQVSPPDRRGPAGGSPGSSASAASRTCWPSSSSDRPRMRTIRIVC